MERFDAANATPQAVNLLAHLVEEHVRAHGASAKLEDAMQRLYLLRLDNPDNARAFESA